LEFEWDEQKRLQVLEKHGVDFVDALLIFEGPVLTLPDLRRDYGEDRFTSIGLVDGECIVVVHTDRNAVRRLISAWRGGRRDYEHYKAHDFGRSTPDA